MKRKRFITNKPVITIDWLIVKELGISEKELNHYLPKYISNPVPLSYGWCRWFWFNLIRLFIAGSIWVFLRPRLKSTGKLDQSEVDSVYNKEAKTYNKKHHLTTRGIDLVWRRATAWFAVILGRNRPGQLTILDLCTGTGLVPESMVTIFSEWNIRATIFGLDYNSKMLAQAKRRVSSNQSITVNFVRGDATNLVKGERKPTEKTMVQFAPNSFDAITQMCGIGGISEPLRVFDDVLRILKPDGQFFMSDMHRPISTLPGEWPFLLKWCRFSIFEAFVYEKITVPLALKRLWGWQDPTVLFYFLPLTTYQDSQGKWWGFEVKVFEQESQRWWLSLPIMPVAKIAVEKVRLDEEVAKERGRIFEMCRFNKKLI